MTRQTHNSDAPKGNIPQPEKDSQGRIKGEFYPLQRAELIEMHRQSLINNAAYVHLALRYENPFCNRPIEIIPKEFSTRWEMPENSVYKAVAHLADQSVLSIKRGRLVVAWVEHDSTHPPGTGFAKQQNAVTIVEQGDSQQQELIDSQNLELFRNSKNICESENEFSDPQMDFQIRKNQQPDSTYTPKPSSLRSIKNFLDPLDTDGGGKKPVEKEEVKQQVQTPISKVVDQGDTAHHVDKVKTVRPAQGFSGRQYSGGDCNDLLQVFDNHGILEKVEDLIEDMKEQGIKPTMKVVAAIKECDISQLTTGLRHVVETRSSIKDPSAVFVKQSYDAPVETLGPREPVRTAEEMGYWSTPAEIAISNMDRIKAMMRNKGLMAT